MAIMGTFSSFTAARLGIYASQWQLQVTGNNIANINTNGYTRQRADLFSLNATGLAKYATGLGPNVGYGVLVNSVTQLRDPFLDIRFRNQNTKTAEAEATLAGLQKIAQTLDEVNKGGESQNGVIENALQQMLTMLEGLSDRVGSEEYDGLVREAAKSLTSFFNTAADKLQRDWNLQADELADTVKSVNKCLTNIRDLNEQIRKQGIYGDNALELRDHRNLYIDELSQYLGIDVEYSMERIDQYTEVEKLTIYLKDSEDPRNPGHRIKLVDGLYATQLTQSTKEANPLYNPNGEKTGSALYAETKEVNGVTLYKKANIAANTPDDEQWTQNIMEAALYRKNPNYKAGSTKESEKYPYIDQNGVWCDSLPEPQEIVSDKPYLTAEGTPTNGDTEKGDAAAGEVEKNKFLFQLERLEDKYGRVMDRGKSTESVVIPLGDTDLQGAIQAMRELLTEEGEFASNKDVGIEGNYSDLRGSDDKASIKKGIPYYQKRLDLLAQKIAEVFNDANVLPANLVYQMDENTNQFWNEDDFVEYGKDENDQPLYVTLDDVTIAGKDEKGNTIRISLETSKGRELLRAKLKEEHDDWSDEKIEEEMKNILAKSVKCMEALRDQGQLTKEYDYYDGGVLFSNAGNNNDPTGITAKNISVSADWSARLVRVLNSIEPNEMDKNGNPIPRSSANDNIMHMIALFTTQLEYTAGELEPDAYNGTRVFFEGSFQEMYTDLGATLGMEQSTMDGIAYNYEVMTLDLDNDRISVYGVDLNDEATSMMQFQKSYQAACRLLSTLDSMLDTLINGTLR